MPGHDTTGENPILAPYKYAQYTIRRDLWTTSNHRLHHQERARRVSELKTTAYVLAKQGHYPTFHEPVWVHATIRLPTRRRFDPPNAWPTVKPIIDGLTDAGVFKDDDSTHIPYTSFSRDPVPSPKGTYNVTLYVIPESADIYVPF